jgi:hypothetical protein
MIVREYLEHFDVHLDLLLAQIDLATLRLYSRYDGYGMYLNLGYSMHHLTSSSNAFFLLHSFMHNMYNEK